MQGADSGETLRVEAYRVVALSEPIADRVECLTTRDDLLFVGTADAKIVAYATHADKAASSSGAATANTVTVSTGAALTLLQRVADPRRQPVRSLTVVGDRHLLALVGDTIVLYTFTNTSNQSDAGRVFALREVTAITGLKDTISFHVKQQRGVVALAALQRRRLTIYEATLTNLEFLLKETVALPDGVRTFGWLGRSFVLGGRKEYFIYHTSSSSSTALYPTPRSGAAPLVLPMAPVPEVLVCGDGCGMRALLSDGSEVPGDARVPWPAAPPIAMQYEHPYVVTQHASGPHTLQVRLPLLTTLGASVKSGGKNSLLQYIDVPKLARVSQCWWTDYDCPMPTKQTKATALARHPIVAADTSNRLFFLLRNSVAVQADGLARRKLFAAADLLCQLCPHEVQADTLQRVVVAGAMHRFLALGDYAGCFHELSKIEADVRLAIQLFPGFMPAEEADASRAASSASAPAENPRCPPLPVDAPTAVTSAALPAFVEYLQSRRVALLLSGTSSASSEATRALLRCVDRALVLSWCALKAEAPLVALLQGENWCAQNDTAAVLRAHHQWVALTVLREAHGAFEAAATQLQELVCGEAAVSASDKSVRKDVREVLQRWATEHSTHPASNDVYLPQASLEEWAGSAGCGDADAIKALIGLATALTFFRRRSLPSQQQLFAQHLTWLLGCAPPENGLRIFFSAQNVQQYATTLRLLEGYTEAPGQTSKQLLMVSFLHLLFSDGRVKVTEEALYEQYWRGLGELLFTSTPPAVQSASLQARYRSRLDEFLLTSPHVHLESAEHFFNADAIKAQCIPERALIYRRQGAHRSAVEMFLREAGDMAAATSYANGVRNDDGGDAFTALLELLLRPSDGTPQVEAALSILNTCDGVDASLVLPMLPDDLPFAQLSDFLLHAFRDAATGYHMAAVDNSVLAAKLMTSQETQLREIMRCAVLEDNMVCPVCQRKLRPDTLVAVFPNGLLTHQGCVKDEHVCPATHRDYRYDAYSLLEDL